MKKIRLFFLLFAILFLFVGCGKDENIETIQTNQPENKEKDEVEINLEEEEKAVEVEEETISIDEVDEIVQPRYTLEADYKVKPIDEGDDKNVVLITIDDAPEQYAVKIAELLKEKDINAIFFVNGHFIQSEEGKARLKTIYDLGFVIGNHTMSHLNLKKLAEDKQREEIIKLNDLVEEITGERPRFFRAPFGANTELSKQIAQEENMQWMNWTYGYDYFKEYMEKEALEDIMVNTNLLIPGANLLMHDRKWTYEALPKIISGLEEKGYSFVDPKLIK